MSVKDVKLSRNQTRCIKALLEHPRIEDAASAAGVSDRTVYRWLNDPVFVAALRSAESELLSDGIRSLIVDMRDNHETMREIRDNLRYSANVRLRAAQSLDNSLLKWRDIQNVDERLAALEVKVYGASK